MPLTEVMLTILPQRARVIGRARCFVQWKQLVRLVAMTSFQSASLILKRRPSRVMPALLTRMSMSGISARSASHALAIAAPSATSTASARALPPDCVIAAAAAPQESADLDTQMTMTPLRASVSAIARPIPRPAPVTSAVLLLKVSMGSLVDVPLIAFLLFHGLDVVGGGRRRHPPLP